jgi:hypothetical protein
VADNNKSKSAKTSRELDLTGFLFRLVATTLLVLATYNPGGFSFAHWVKTAFAENGLGPEHFVVGVVLVIGWIVLLSATYRSMGLLGLILGAAMFGGLVWLLVDIGVLSIDSTSELTWIILIVASIVLAIGLSWSHVWRRLTGQFEVDGD